MLCLRLKRVRRVFHQNFDGVQDARAKLPHASFTISTREVRTNTITASYAEDATFAASTAEGLNGVSRALCQFAAQSA